MLIYLVTLLIFCSSFHFFGLAFNDINFQRMRMVILYAFKTGDFAVSLTT